jgi:uncharacterized protein (TIGR00661 family)
MKILYAIQGTGNGHLSRATDIIPLLEKKGDVDLLVSGTQADVELPYNIKYKLKGLSFIFGKSGGVDLLETYKKSNLKKLYAEIKSLPIEKYDLVINDFEPVSAWACFFKKKECIALSHQAAVINKKSPHPTHAAVIGRTILKNYAPFTSKYGFHFKAYNENIFTPVIRSQVRNCIPEDAGHYTVYLPAYDDDKIIKVLKETGDHNWQIFSKHSGKAYTKKNFTIKPICSDAFIESMRTCTGMLCGAGFETPAEALFMKKKLLVIPMKNQYEQQCNAAALEEMNVKVLTSLKRKFVEEIKSWMDEGDIIEVDYPDITNSIINIIFKNHYFAPKSIVEKGQYITSLKEFKYFTGKKILLKKDN